MNLRSVIPSFTILCMVSLIAAGAEQNRKMFDPFAFDGSRNIMEEAHFGIINGKLTAGVQYRDVFSISGLWAPPYASSDFDLKITAFGRPIATEHYTWRPLEVDRSGVIEGVAIESVTMLIPGYRAGLVAVTLKNQKTERRTIPLTLGVGGTLDRVGWWNFDRTQSKTATTRKVADATLAMEQGVQAIVLRMVGDVRWDDAQPYVRGSISLPASGEAKFCIVFAIGPSGEAGAACQKIAADPQQTIADARAAYANRLQELFQKLPRLESSNAALEKFYYRSLAPLLMNRWDVPEFLLHPHYTVGSVKGGCVCNYLWDFGEIWEIFPLGRSPRPQRTLSSSSWRST